jgi:hypothetical protein
MPRRTGEKRRARAVQFFRQIFAVSAGFHARPPERQHSKLNGALGLPFLGYRFQMDPIIAVSREKIRTMHHARSVGATYLTPSEDTDPVVSQVAASRFMAPYR